MISAVPFATAVTMPDDRSTLATASLLDDHVTDDPVSSTPFWPVTLALSVAVAVNASKETAAGVTATVAGWSGSEQEVNSPATTIGRARRTGSRLISAGSQV
ncbi:MAG: hypothetical protein A2W29_06165 [Gemmatimonadetes bacterium RBG_16_66_8]|nr:MAG: hypothetical protein A2W29_06165 [Gemmatimonadetes bacterium RBG_16_66_8]